MAQQLWERLRATGLQDVATAFFDHGVRSLDDIMPNAAALIVAGVPPWKLEAVLRRRVEVSRALPPKPPQSSADRAAQAGFMGSSIEAALPAKRQALLEAVQADILAATTRSSVDSRIRALQELCRLGSHSRS